MKTVFEVRIVILSENLTLRIATLPNQADAEKEARRLHSRDQQPYQVTKVDKQCVFKIK